MIKIQSQSTGGAFNRVKFHETFPGMYHIGIVTDVIALGTALDTGYNTEKNEFRVEWEFPDCRAVIREGQPAEAQKLGRDYNAKWGSDKKPSHLFNDVTSMMGRRPTKEEMNAFDPYTFFLGNWFQVAVMASKTGAYTNVMSIQPLPPGAELKHAESGRRFKFDFDQNFNPEMVGKEIRGRVEERLRSSHEWKKIAQPPAGQEIGSTPNPSFASPTPAPTPAPTQAPTQAPSNNSNVPF